ncbi:MAG TPA: hypothetical protein VKM94_01560 [Blastocatellia bacterium]|nr:hypothetical protein [Blastocatellia bacterium]
MIDRRSIHNNEVPENDAFLNLISLSWESIAEFGVRLLSPFWSRSRDDG